MSILLSCISTKHSLLKRHWEQAKQETVACPVTTLGSHRKPGEDQGGLLCLLDENGEMLKSMDLPMPAGMTFSEQGVFVASIETISEVAPDLSWVKPGAVSLPSFSLLHSLARTRSGYLAASTGLDAIIEFTHSGEQLWSWWATEHGFETTPTGEIRTLDPTADYRGAKYGTLAQTTHVNSAVELSDGSLLASLFHQGMIIRIERESGDWQPVLEDLDHPHSIRILNDDYITVADTGRGRGLVVRLMQGRGAIEAMVEAGTTWLQDCLYDYKRDYWMLIDGKNSRISLRSGLAGEKALAQIDLSPEWRLYEVLPVSNDVAVPE